MAIGTYCVTLVPTQMRNSLLCRIPDLPLLDYTDLTGIETLVDAATACAAAWNHVDHQKIGFKLHVLHGDVLAPATRINELFVPGIPGTLFVFALPPPDVSEMALFRDLLSVATMDSTTPASTMASQIVGEAQHTASNADRAAVEARDTAAEADRINVAMYAGAMESDDVVAEAVAAPSAESVTGPAAAPVVNTGEEAIPAHLIGRIELDLWKLILVHHKGALPRLRKPAACTPEWVEKVIEQVQAAKEERSSVRGSPKSARRIN